MPDRGVAVQLTHDPRQLYDEALRKLAGTSGARVSNTRYFVDENRQRLDSAARKAHDRKTIDPMVRLDMMLSVSLERTERIGPPWNVRRTNAGARSEYPTINGSQDDQGDRSHYIRGHT
ncbi:hypothetical protein Y032_0009g756 [Ancylostoma ceylanicum]|uniref:Uncharacterized protein n=1 Tax=Ancylostoma ceylanicum TaxID=53326 RepID=A0A016VL46_9BILA|nr:hypothetical protein Y032_0009g756 [Ancylostoma ceylanicum]